MVVFKNRQAAGELLVKRLEKFNDAKDTVVLAIPRGGAVVASEISKSLNLPLDIVVTRKIGAPTQPELALGAVAPNGEVVWDQMLLDELGVKSEQLSVEVKNQLEEIKRREKLYRQERPPLGVKNKVVILVDDGIATGATVISAIKYLNSLGAKRVILAVPIAAKDALKKVPEVVDEIYVLHQVDFLGAVGSFYQDFHPITDEEVIELLNYER